MPDSVLVGLGTLAAASPIWGGQPEWLEMLDRLRTFSMRWHAPALRQGWSDEDLYGLDASAPYARVGRMGAAWLACAPGRQVVDVDAIAIRIVCRTASRLSIYRPERGGALAWELGQA